MADGFELSFHHAMVVLTHYEKVVNNRTDNMDSVINMNLAKVLFGIKESSQDVVTTVDNTFSFIESGVFGAAPQTRQQATQPTPLAKTAAERSDSVAQNDFQKKPQGAEVAAELSLTVNLNSAPQTESKFELPNLKQDGRDFADNVVADAKQFAEGFNKSSHEFADIFTGMKDQWNSGPGFKRGSQDYLAAAHEALKYNELGQSREGTTFKKYILEECIPCSERILALGDLLSAPSDFLDLLEQDIKSKLEELKRIFDILFSPPVNTLDLCELLKFLSFTCVPDLYGMLMFLINYLKQYVILEGLVGNFGLAVSSLLGAILSPLLSGLNSMLDSYIDLIMGPIDCILDALTNQLRKMDALRAIDPSLSAESALGDFSPDNTKLDLHKAFNQGYKNSATMVDGDKNTGFPHDSAFRNENGGVQKRPLLLTMEAVGTSVGILFNTLLFSRDWVNSQLAKARKSIEDFITRATKARNQGVSYVELAKQIGFLISVIMTIIKIKNGSAFLCESDDDMSQFLNEFGRTSQFNPTPVNDLPPEVRDFLNSTPDGESNQFALVPNGLAAGIKVYDNQVITEKEIPGFGILRVPVKFVKKCSGEISFSEDEKVKKWLENLQKQKV